MITKIYIPIGVQCLTPMLLNENKLRTKSYPFDWILSNPYFVYKILYFLLEDNMDINELVKEHFFRNDIKCSIDGLYNWKLDKNGTKFCNTRYNVIYPHDNYNDVNKYIRRFERLKTDILDQNKYIQLIYISQSSLKNGNFTINGECVIQNVYENLNKIYNLLQKYNKNSNILVFDAIQNEDIDTLNKEIVIYKISQKEGGFSKISNEVNIILKKYLCIYF